MLLLCSPVGDTVPDLSTVDISSLALCKSPTAIIALTDLVLRVVQSASHSQVRSGQVANRYDVDKALRSAVDRGATSVAWVCPENIVSSFSPTVNLKGVTPDQFVGSFTGFSIASAIDCDNLQLLRNEHAKSEYYRSHVYSLRGHPFD